MCKQNGGGGFKLGPETRFCGPHLVFELPEVSPVQLVRVVDHLTWMNFCKNSQQLVDFTQNCEINNSDQFKSIRNE